MTVNHLSRFVDWSEKQYSTSIENLRNSKKKGFNGFFRRQLASRVATVALPIFCTAMLTLKLVAGIVDLSVGTFYSLRDGQRDITVFSAGIAGQKVKSIGKSALGIIFGGVIALFDPSLAKPLLRKSYVDPFTDVIIPRIKQEAADGIYDMLELLHNVFADKDAPVDYILDGGSLLGAVRNGGLIPWDDDADIVILEKHHQNFLNKAKELHSKGYAIAKFWTGYKIFPIDGKKQEKAEVLNPVTGKFEEGYICYPFVDVFVMDLNENRYELSSSFPESQKLWPNEYFTTKEWDNITEVPFGHLNLRGLKKEHATDYLVRGYGEEWNAVAYRWWDHENCHGLRQIKSDLLDHTHPVRSVQEPGAKIHHRVIATHALNTMTPDQRDQNWQLDQFFGTVRVINLEKDKVRMEGARQHGEAVGLKGGQLQRFSGCNGRENLSEDVWSRMQSNYKKISTRTEEGKKLLDRQHMGQAGCYMSHYQLIKEISENYDRARVKYLQLKKNPKATAIQLTKAKSEVKKYSSVLILEDDNQFGRILKEHVTEKGWGTQVYSDTLTTEGVGTIFYEAMRDLPEDWDMLYFMAQSYKKPLKTESPRLRKLVEASCLNAYAVNARMYPKLLSQLRQIEHRTHTFKAVDEEIAQLHKKNNCFVIAPGIAVQPGEESVINNVKQKNKKRTYWQCQTV